MKLTLGNGKNQKKVIHLGCLVWEYISLIRKQKKIELDYYDINTGKLAYDRLNGTSEIGPL